MSDQAQVEAAAKAFIAPYDSVTSDTLRSFVDQFPNNIYVVMAMSITPHSAQAILDFRAALSASPPAPQPASQDTTQYGWVIEGAWSAAQTIEYWTGGPLWSQDHMNAIRFARREDAERAAFMMLDGMNVRVVEHGWDQSHALQPASQWLLAAAPPTVSDMQAFGASDAACYKWPGDTPEHKALRAAYIAGAADVFPAAAPAPPGDTRANWPDATAIEIEALRKRLDAQIEMVASLRATNARYREALEQISGRRADLAAASKNDYDSGYSLATEMCADIADAALAQEGA